MRIVFMGTPDFALPALNVLFSSCHEISAIVSQPDKPGNRGEISFSPVKQFALDNNIPLYQFSKIRLEGASILSDISPDVVITAAYGQILSREIIDIPKHGILNIHASLLPKYRGSSPIQWAIINGEKTTGITIMQTAEGLDCGDILMQESVDILSSDDAENMFQKLSILGGQCILSCLDKLEKGQLLPVKQVENEASYFPMLKKTDGKINWSDSATNIYNKVRGMAVWPVAYTSLNGKSIKIYKAELCGIDFDSNIGEVYVSHKDIFVKTGNGVLKILELQPEGKRKMLAHEYVNGAKLLGGETFI